MLIINRRVEGSDEMDYDAHMNGLTEDNKKVFTIILRFGPLTKKKIIEYTQMKLTTLNRSIQVLLQSKLVVEIGEQASTGGRKPTLFDVNPVAYYLVGIDISRTYSKLIITNLKRQILYDAEFEMKEDMTPEKTVAYMQELFIEGLRTLALRKESILGGGLGTIGPLDPKEGMIYKPNNFSARGWNNVPIGSMLEEALGIHIHIDNGANTAVFSDYLSNSIVEYKNIVYVNCGIGIRTGVMAGGKIISTIHNSNDAFGHMVVNFDGEACYCGQDGCIECYASILAIEKTYKRRLAAGQKSKIAKQIDNITYSDIIRAADYGESLAEEVLASAARILGIGLVNYVTLVNPEKIILSGPLMNQSDTFYHMVIDYIEKSVLQDGHSIVFVRGGAYKDNAIALGAAHMFLWEKIQ